MRVWHCKVAPNVSSDPVSDISLIHGVDVDLILPRARLVEIPWLGCMLHTKSKFGVFAEPVFRVSWVSKIKISCPGVSTWPWYPKILHGFLSHLSVLPYFFVLDHSSFTVSFCVAKCTSFKVVEFICLILTWELLPFEGLARILRPVLPWTNRIFDLLKFRLATQLRLNNDKARNRKRIWRLIHTWSRHSIIFVGLVDFYILPP